MRRAWAVQFVTSSSDSDANPNGGDVYQAEIKCVCFDCPRHISRPVMLAGDLFPTFSRLFIVRSESSMHISIIEYYCWNNWIVRLSLFRNGQHQITDLGTAKQPCRASVAVVGVSGNKFKFRHYRYAKLILSDSLMTISDERSGISVPIKSSNWQYKQWERRLLHVSITYYFVIIIMSWQLYHYGAAVNISDKSRNCGDASWLQ